MKKTLSTIAAALFAVSLGSSQIGCVKRTTVISTTDASIVEAVEKRDSKIRDDLEDIAKSVHCVKLEAEYTLEGSDILGMTEETGGYGTAFAYRRFAGYTYLVTNAHIVDVPDTRYKIDIVPRQRVPDDVNPGDVDPGDIEDEVEQFTIVFDKYELTKKSITLVDNMFDEDTSDDISVETIAIDKENDIAVLRTRANIPVSDNYSFVMPVRQELADEVYIVGYPEGMLSAATKGIVANPDFEINKVNAGDMLDATATFGNSGSPYFVRRGDQLHWAGTIGAIYPYGDSKITLLSIGIPLKRFYRMLINPESAVKQEDKEGHDEGDEEWD